MTVGGEQDRVEQLWQQHLRAPFPARLRGGEVAGVDLVMLDADVGGCVSSWLANQGRLDNQRRQVLRACLVDLDRVLSLLTDHDEAEYYQRLRVLAASLPAADTGARPDRAS